MKVWISKRWATRGVYAQIVERPTIDDDGRYVYTKHGNSLGEQLRVGRDCFAIHADAVANARQRAERKVKPLERQLVKVRLMAGSFA